MKSIYKFKFLLQIIIQNKIWLDTYEILNKLRKYVEKNKKGRE
jgi:hypothetical protein